MCKTNCAGKQSCGCPTCGDKSAIKSIEVKSVPPASFVSSGYSKKQKQPLPLPKGSGYSKKKDKERPSEKTVAPLIDANSNLIKGDVGGFLLAGLGFGLALLLRFAMERK